MVLFFFCWSFSPRSAKITNKGKEICGLRKSFCTNNSVSAFICVRPRPMMFAILRHGCLVSTSLSPNSQPLAPALKAPQPLRRRAHLGRVERVAARLPVHVHSCTGVLKHLRQPLGLLWRDHRL